MRQEPDPNKEIILPSKHQERIKIKPNSHKEMTLLSIQNLKTLDL